MRRSPRRPLILKRRKLPFQQNDATTAAGSQSQLAASGSEESTKPDVTRCFPDGIRIMNHPSMSDTQVVVIPKTADLQSVIGALTAKGKECGAQGPNKFILLSESGSCNNGSFCQAAAEVDGVSTIRADGQPVKVETMRKPPGAKPLTGIKSLNKELECRPLDESLTNIQWLGRMSPSTLEPAPPKQVTGKENRDQDVQALQAQDKPAEEEAVQQPTSERPPYSYMAMIQFAINSQKNRRMTLKEIYTWIEEHFPYFREVAKPGWKNSIRHNLSLHDMFIRDTSPDGKVSFWTIRPEANRCLTLDQVYRLSRNSFQLFSQAADEGTEKSGDPKNSAAAADVRFRENNFLLQEADFTVMDSSAFSGHADSNMYPSRDRHKTSCFHRLSRMYSQKSEGTVMVLKQ